MTYDEYLANVKNAIPGLNNGLKEELKQNISESRQAVEDLTKLRSIHNGSYSKSIDKAVELLKDNIVKCQRSDVWLYEGEWDE